MKLKYSITAKGILAVILMTVSSVFISCRSSKVINYAAFQLEQVDLDRITNKIILTSKLSEEKDPMENLTFFEVRKGNKIIVYVNWFDLPTKELCMKVNLIGSDNTIFDQDFTIFNPTQPVWYTWLEFTLTENITPLGDIKIQVFLNNNLIKETNTKFVKPVF